MKATNFNFEGQTAFYRGKVRDVYTVDNQLIMVATDRISAFDVVLPRSVPHKGQVLNQMAAYFLRASSDVAPNWLAATPDPNVTCGTICEPFPIEMVIRGYLAGHAWRTYAAGGRALCGVTLPDGLQESDPLPAPIITPTTKAHKGHDEDISQADILAQNIVSRADYAVLENYTHQLFQRGSEMAAERGLILVDTKYEFGKKADGTICVIDEIHTPDSSRYFYAEDYQERQNNRQKQPQLSKEFVREWLIANGFQGKEAQQMPTMSDDFVAQISARYIELFERMTGKAFEKNDPENMSSRIENNINQYLKSKK